jgi:hypothetical protein
LNRWLLGSTILLHDACYAFADTEFSLGPIDLTVRRGEFSAVFADYLLFDELAAAHAPAETRRPFLGSSHRHHRTRTLPRMTRPSDQVQLPELHTET